MLRASNINSRAAGVGDEIPQDEGFAPASPPAACDAICGLRRHYHLRCSPARRYASCGLSIFFPPRLSNDFGWVLPGTALPPLMGCRQAPSLPALLPFSRPVHRVCLRLRAYGILQHAARHSLRAPSRGDTLRFCALCYRPRVCVVYLYKIGAPLARLPHRRVRSGQPSRGCAAFFWGSSLAPASR